MPDGIYLNANNLTGVQLAEKMDESIKDKEKYYEYFKWHGHYSYHAVTDSADTDPLCTFCAFLNVKPNEERKQVYARFVKWWNGFDSKVDATEDIIMYFNNSHTIFKSVLKSTTKEPHQPIIVQSVTPSIVDGVGDFVSNLLKFYFN